MPAPYTFRYAQDDHQGRHLGARQAGFGRPGPGHDDGCPLDAESRRLEAEYRWSAIEAAYGRLQHEDPAAWREYLAELGELSAGEPDATAAEEWPEHNA